MADEFQTNLMRAQFAATWTLISLQVAQGLFGKSYMSLSLPEKGAVDQMVLTTVGQSYSMATPEWFAAQKAAEAVGFHGPTQTAPSSSHPPAAKK
jgi:hypothetical protein